MKRRRGWFFLSFLIAIGLLTGCGGQNIAQPQNNQSQGDGSQGNHSQDMKMDQNMEMNQNFTIEFSTDPNPVTVNHPARLIERVTKNGQPVTDAIVKMEIWKEGNSQHEIVDASAGQNGTYTVEKTFEQAGLYHVTLHTSVQGYHQMPTKDFQVK